jgi:hypothetical protein
VFTELMSTRAVIAAAPTNRPAGAAQALLRAGQLDELKRHVAPVLLGQRRATTGGEAEQRYPSGHFRFCGPVLSAERPTVTP